jgi:hypothetical protein
MNSQGFLVSCAANCSGLLNGCLRRPPGWPVLEALAITAIILLAIVAVELIVHFVLEFPTP